MKILGVLAVAATILVVAGCGSTSDPTTVAGFDPEVGLEGVVDCLTGDGWTETGSATGTSGQLFTVDSEAGTSVLLSTYLPDEEPTLDSTTFEITAADSEVESLKVEVIIGSISDEERAQIDDCAAG